VVGLCGVVSYACERRVNTDPSGQGGTALSGGAGPGGSGAAGPGIGAAGPVGEPTCREKDDAFVYACAASSARIPVQGLPTTTVVGNLTRAEITDAASTCFLNPVVAVGGIPPLTEQVVALQVVSGGDTWDVALQLPGASLAGLTIGDEVELSVRAEGSDYDEYAHVGVRRRGEVVLAAARSDGSQYESPGMFIEAGAEECRNAPGDCCTRANHSMSVTVGTEKVEVPTDSSVPVGGLLVTNERFSKLYDTGGCCNHGSPAFVVGAAALSASPRSPHQE
jgi:hypothetical protein